MRAAFRRSDWTFGERRKASPARLSGAGVGQGANVLEVYSPPPAAWLSDIVTPLVEKFGQDLTLTRSGNIVCWGYDGQSAVVELNPDGTLRATFIDCERKDVVSENLMAAAYRTRSMYALTGPSCARMVADMVDFFSGVREPRFTFVDAYPR